MVFALCALVVHGVTHWGQFALGLPIMIFAFGLTLRGYRFLGLDNTYCESGGLVTGGMYAYSRNPQYVTSVIATIGLAITCGSPLTGPLRTGALCALLPVRPQRRTLAHLRLWPSLPRLHEEHTALCRRP